MFFIYVLQVLWRLWGWTILHFYVFSGENSTSETETLWLLPTILLGMIHRMQCWRRRKWCPYCFRTCRYSGLGHVLAESLWSSYDQLPVSALLTLPSISEEYEAFTDSVSGSEIGIFSQKLQKFTKIIRELPLAPRNFVNESCLEVNPVLEWRHCYVFVYIERQNYELKGAFEI